MISNGVTFETFNHLFFVTKNIWIVTKINNHKENDYEKRHVVLDSVLRLLTARHSKSDEKPLLHDLYRGDSIGIFLTSDIRRHDVMQRELA